ncbi:MAG: hypothetical protein JNN05_03550 [Candidatus Omnitrophica bacterium]|nr:hypothetical protein [Candidatus Omnitrophota bacterium]
MPEVSTLRLYLMRALYLLMFVGQGVIQWPAIKHAYALTFWHGVGSSLLFAMALLAALGIRYPLQMLPLLFFELVWKTIWLTGVALPLWLGDQLSAETAASAKDCLMGVIIPFVIPWRYVIANYVKRPGDRWR